MHLERKRLIWDGRLFERIRCVSYGDAPATLPRDFSFDADFKDMFEVRGQTRAHRGHRASPTVLPMGVKFQYEGLDGNRRDCVIAFSERPTHLDAHHASIRLELGPRTPKDVYLEVGPEGGPPPAARRFRRASLLAKAAMRRRLRRGDQDGAHDGHEGVPPASQGVGVAPAHARKGVDGAVEVRPPL